LKLNKEIPVVYFNALAIAVYLMLFMIVVLSRSSTCFDEKLFINNMALFNKHGLSRTFLLQMTDQAPGPLYQLVHYPLQSLTKLSAPAVRIVNMVLFVVVIFFTWLNIRMVSNKSSIEAFTWASSLLFVPVIWQVAGLALTEMPAMCAISISIYFLFRSVTGINYHQKIFSFLFTFLSGFFLGLAILGRSPFLLIIFSAIPLFIYPKSNGRNFLHAAIFLIPAAAITWPVFYVWQALVPPHQQYIGKGLSLWHGFLAFAYMGLTTIFVAPKWFAPIRNRWIFFVVGYLVLLLLNYYVFGLTYYTLGFTVKKFVTPHLFQYYPYLIAPVLLLISIYFIFSGFYRAKLNAKNAMYLFILFSSFLMLASCAGITHLFSTRYVAQVSPLFLVALAGFDNFTTFRIMRLLAAALIGALSLLTYLTNF
jgi:hypothetical protein